MSIGFPVLIPWNLEDCSLFSCPHNKVAHCSLCEEHLPLDLVPIDMVPLQKVLPVINAQTERAVLCSLVINSFLKVYGHLTSSTPSSPMRPSGDAPNTPPSSNQRPVSTGWIPDIWLKHWMARDSLSTPQATALTLLMSSRRFMSEGVVRFALRTTPKLLAVSLPFLAWCQAGLLLWPAVIWLTCLITSSPIFASSMKCANWLSLVVCSKKYSENIISSIVLRGSWDGVEVQGSSANKERWTCRNFVVGRTTNFGLLRWASSQEDRILSARGTSPKPTGGYLCCFSCASTVIRCMFCSDCGSRR